jgi:hypothetical protein
MTALLNPQRPTWNVGRARLAPKFARACGLIAPIVAIVLLILSLLPAAWHLRYRAYRFSCLKDRPYRDPPSKITSPMPMVTPATAPVATEVPRRSRVS